MQKTAPVRLILLRLLFSNIVVRFSSSRRCVARLPEQSTRSVLFFSPVAKTKIINFAARWKIADESSRREQKSIDSRALRIEIERERVSGDRAIGVFAVRKRVCETGWGEGGKGRRARKSAQGRFAWPPRFSIKTSSANAVRSAVASRTREDTYGNGKNREFSFLPSVSLMISVRFPLPRLGSSAFLARFQRESPPNLTNQRFENHLQKLDEIQWTARRIKCELRFCDST